MTTGERIRSVRKQRKLTQKALGERLGVSQATVGQYETNQNPPKFETLRRIADALDVPILYLLGEVKVVPQDVALDQKLACVGCSVGFYEEDDCVWINYPDGTLEVTEDDLKTLNDASDSYMRFLLNELKTQNLTRFKPK